MNNPELSERLYALHDTIMTQGPEAVESFDDILSAAAQVVWDPDITYTFKTSLTGELGFIDLLCQMIEKIHYEEGTEAWVRAFAFVENRYPREYDQTN